VSVSSHVRDRSRPRPSRPDAPAAVNGRPDGPAARRSRPSCDDPPGSILGYPRHPWQRTSRPAAATPGPSWRPVGGTSALRI
jgi:hypothetical protein